MKEFLKRVLDVIEGKVEYGDVRVVEQRAESIKTKNGKVEGVSSANDTGFGVRVVVSGAWGFASSSKLDKKEIERVVKEAIDIANASGKVKGERVFLSKEKPASGKYKTKIDLDPFKVPLNEKISLLLSCDEEMAKVKKVKVRRGNMDFFSKKQIFGSTDGGFFEQEIIESGVGISALAVEGNDVQIRSYPNSFGGDFAQKGYEYINEIGLLEHSKEIAEESAMLLSAEDCPQIVTNVILSSSQLALQIHESIGHPLELDRVLGTEASYAGTSFVTLDKLNKFRYGSPHVSVYADATVPGALGSFGFDDEGVSAQRVCLIKNGIFVGYLSSRETAPVIGRNSSGAMRADGWNRIPLIRMTNINIEPGKWELQDLINDTDEGILFGTNKSWSIDDKRLNFQFGCEIAWGIKNGKLGKIYKNATYTGITPDFWNSCDAICNLNYYHVWGIPNCGKGQPGQFAHVGHGASPARFRNVRVGVKG